MEHRSSHEVIQLSADITFGLWIAVVGAGLETTPSIETLLLTGGFITVIISGILQRVKPADIILQLYFRHMKRDENRYIRLAPNLFRRYPSTFVQNYANAYTNPLMYPSRRNLTSCIYLAVSAFLSAGAQSPAFAQHFLIRTLLVVAGLIVALTTYGAAKETAQKLEVVACYLTMPTNSEEVLRSIERGQFERAGADLDRLIAAELHRPPGSLARKEA